MNAETSFGAAPSPRFSTTSPLDRAASHFGSISALARALSRSTGRPITSQSITKWRAARHVPDRWWLAIEAATRQRVMAREFLLWHEGHDDPRPLVDHHYRRYVATMLPGALVTEGDEEVAA